MRKWMILIMVSVLFGGGLPVGSVAAQNAFELGLEPPPPNRPLTVLEIQASLSILGHDPGPLDGAAGAQTRQALVAFAREQGYAYSGGPLTEQMQRYLRFNLGVALGGDGCEDC